MKNTAFRDFLPVEASANVVALGNRDRRHRVWQPNCDWRDSVESQLNELTSLSPGWDGYGAAPVKFTNANFALHMLASICDPTTSAPTIVPGTGGDLQIEWHENGVDIELHVIAPNQVSAWHRTPNTIDTGEELLLSNDFTMIADWVDKLMEPEGAPAAAVQ